MKYMTLPFLFPTADLLDKVSLSQEIPFFPLHKKGEKSCISNYRPISLLTAFSEIFEKVIYKGVSNF
jgi:hypothetical protein